MVFTVKIFILLALTAVAVGQTSPEPPTTEDDKTTEGGPTPTTPAPTTPASSPKPTIPPTADPGKSPKVGSWNLTEGSRTCILSKMAVRLQFTYVTSDNKTQKIAFDIPAGINDTKLEGTCGDEDASPERLDIMFYDNWNMSFLFIYNKDNKIWSVTTVSLTYNASLLTNGTGQDMDTASLSNTTLFKTPNGSSFQCVSNQTTSNPLRNAANDVQVQIHTSSLRIEAFRSADLGKFAISVACQADTEVSNIVPIAVGAALAGLVVIVLIAYLIGRKRNKRGYESV